MQCIVLVHLPSGHQEGVPEHRAGRGAEELPGDPGRPLHQAEGDVAMEC